jgi:multidrug efflux pump subunit AcrA (membrane-fusion protein)
MFDREQPVTVERAQVLSTLQENLRRHQVQLESARVLYRERAAAALRRRAQALETGENVNLDFNDLPMPRSFVQDYEDAITAVQWQVGDTMELSSATFRKWVLDRWEWQSTYAQTTGSYISLPNDD